MEDKGRGDVAEGRTPAARHATRPLTIVAGTLTIEGWVVDCFRCRSASMTLHVPPVAPGLAGEVHCAVATSQLRAASAISV